MVKGSIVRERDDDDDCTKTVFDSIRCEIQWGYSESSEVKHNIININIIV